MASSLQRWSIAFLSRGDVAGGIVSNMWFDIAPTVRLLLLIFTVRCNFCLLCSCPL